MDVVALHGDAASPTFVECCDAGNIDLFQSGAPVPTFLCLVTGKSDWPLVFHSIHLFCLRITEFSIFRHCSKNSPALGFHKKAQLKTLTQKHVRTRT